MVKTEARDLATELAQAKQEYESAVKAVESIGRDTLDTVETALTRLDRLIETFEERATGTGDFGGYITFRQQVVDLVEDLPDDLPKCERFEQIASTVDKRRLSERDFDTIRDSIAEIRPLIDRLETETSARHTYRRKRREAQETLETLEDRIAHHDRLLALAEVDLDAPVDGIKAPIDRYNDAIQTAFQEFLERAPAEDVLALFTLTDRYPLIPMERPPELLLQYLDDVPERLTIPELLEYVDYSQSKLEHYVDDPDAPRTAVATDRTYLERLSAEPFTVEWPPPEADVLKWQLRELLSVIDRFAEDESMTKLREVQQLTRDSDHFNQMQDVAVARSTIDETQRQRILSGELAQDRERLAATRDLLATELEDAPPP